MPYFVFFMPEHIDRQLLENFPDLPEVYDALY